MQAEEVKRETGCCDGETMKAQAFDSIMDKYNARRFKGDRDKDFINLVFRYSNGEVLEALDRITDNQNYTTWKPTLQEYVIEALISYRVFGDGEAELQSLIDKAVLFYASRMAQGAGGVSN